VFVCFDLDARSPVSLAWTVRACRDAASGSVVAATATDQQ
jgi:hypothetical protein